MKARVLKRLASLGGLALVAALALPSAASAAPDEPMTPVAPTTFQDGCLTVLAQPLEPDWDIPIYAGSYSGSTLNVTAEASKGRVLAEGA